MCRSNSNYLFWLTLLAGLIGCGSDEIEGLVTQLHDSDAHMRRAAARALKEFPGDKSRAMPVLVECATHDSDMEVRTLSLSALGQLGSSAEKVAPQLAQLLQDPAEQVQIAAALALARIKPRSDDYRAVLVKAMRTGNGGVLLAIGRIGPDAEWAVPTLIGLLSHELVQIRSLAAQTLGKIGPSAKQATPVLEQMSRDKDPAVRAVAEHALQGIRH